MKKAFTLLISLFIAGTLIAQQRAMVDKSLRGNYKEKPKPVLEANNFGPSSPSILKTVGITAEEDEVGITRYDDQSNAAMQNRIYLYDDGTIGVTWIFGLLDGDGFSDRGAGYNYFDGNAWGDPPDARVEDERCGWPSYSPWGENGEVIVTHTGADGYKISKRTEKGTSDWEFTLFPGPPDHEYTIWNRSITSGIDHSRLHVLSLTAPTAYAGTVYEGLDGALTYSYSDDGGESWEMEHELLDGMTSDDYFGFNSDNYSWAEPKGDVIAFIVGAEWHDLFLMKSTDGGDTWTKTVIWNHPFPLWDPNAQFVTETFYCNDGAHHVALDNDGKAHVVFGINSTYSDGTTTYWDPLVGGIAYWNEDMPAFSDELMALSPYGDPGTELVEDYNFIGWEQDVDGDGDITYLNEIAYYYLGLSSMPQIVVGQNNDLYVVYSSVTETFSNGTMNFRHIWARMSPNGGVFWSDFFDLTSDLIHIFDECVYPSVAANSDENIYLTYQKDGEPGNMVWGGQGGYGDNDIVVMKVSKDDITGINENKAFIHDYDVGQNQPNPFSTSTTINVNLRKQAMLHLEVINMMGKQVYKKALQANPGMNSFEINAEGMAKGVYFYTVKAGDSSVTKKMIIE